jgi:hypothetical protein
MNVMGHILNKLKKLKTMIAITIILGIAVIILTYKLLKSKSQINAANVAYKEIAKKYSTLKNVAYEEIAKKYIT